MDPNDEIVISGIGGRYPDCDNFDELTDALLNGIDLITEDNRRFELGTFNTPRRAGKINDVDRFDAGFFGISPRLADVMDPRHRTTLETVFEAIVDSGYNPKELRGTKTGVYVGLTSPDSSSTYEDMDDNSGYALIGSNLGQLANRISYCFDLRGPSFILDTACSSGLYALTNAIAAMESGVIDSAIVSAVNINFNPRNARSFNALHMLSEDGKCKVFATDRNGYVRSEAAITILLQKRSSCRRLYSTVLGAGMNCDGFKTEGITFPSAEMQIELMTSVYDKYNVKADDVLYLEMHGTGTPAGDVVECEAVEKFFCQNRKEPLLIGAVKTNMGHSEIASGLCSITKVLVAMETDIIPANLHCDKLDYSLPGINSGNLKVVKENHPWNGGTASVNCFGFGGANAHVILKSNDKYKLKPKHTSHRLVNVSARTAESVRFYLDKVDKRKDDSEFLALIDEIHKINVDGHFYRGYIVLGGNNPPNEINCLNKEKRPIWFIYSGMGSQWTGMGKDLMNIDVFKKTFNRCANALKPYNIDLENVVTSDDPAVFDDITNCFSAITAIEIALTDVLKALGIEPDYFAGHSLGEVGCAYNNGDLTPEQAMLIGFARGYATKQSKCAPGQMAAVGLGEQEILKLLPKDIYVACINTSSSVTITGPRDSVNQFIQGLAEKGIFARTVKTAGYAFHSKYLDDIGPVLRSFISNVISDPKPRSNKWISSSWKESEWNRPVTKLNSSDYHYHNFASPVLFQEVIKRIPKNAIVIEVGPHGLLTSLLKRELGPDVTCLSLMDRNSKDNIQFFTSNIGKLFINGGQPNLQGLYGKVSYPVGRGTYNIGSLVKWDHQVKWFAPFFEHKLFGKKVTVNTKTEEYRYLAGHSIDGRVLMAATGYLDLVWKVVATNVAKTIEQLPIIFESVKILRATVLPSDQDVIFYVNIMRRSGNFEVFEGGSVCCSGKVKVPKNIANEFLNPDIPMPTVNGYMPLKKQDVYKHFRLKGYSYSGLFQGIEQVDVYGLSGKLKWNENYTTFLDSMLQITLVPHFFPDLLLPTYIHKVVIDPIKHSHISDENKDIRIYHDKDLKLIKSGGIEIINLDASMAPRKHIRTKLVLEHQIFVPYITEGCRNEINLEFSLKMALQIVIENSENHTLQAREILVREENSLVNTINSIMKNEPIFSVNFVDGRFNELDFILCSVDIPDKTMLSQLKRDGFILFYGDQLSASNLEIPIVYQNTYKEQGIFLLRNITPIESYEVMLVNNSDFLWIEKAKEYMKTKEILYLHAQRDDICGIAGLVKCIHFEPKEAASVKCVFIQGNDASTSTIFNPELDYYKGQLMKKLVINVLKDGIWGSYRHVPVNEINRVDVAHACNYVQTIGDLSTLKWIERPSHYHKFDPDSDNVFVFYTALNFKDVMIATGKVAAGRSNDPSAIDVLLGFEYSGISKLGKRVMGITTMAAISLQVMSNPSFTWDVPQSWSLEEAATVPVVYATCYYAMIVRGQMRNDASILIHAGAGGIGLAAISIALSMNCEVFTTCGSQEKREYLLKSFPNLKRENIGNSRNTSFEQMIMRNTKGKGVDVVLNSLAADMFHASIRCIAQRGQFLEIGKVEVASGTPISSKLFDKNASFHGVFLDDLFSDTNKTKQDINRLLNEGIIKGVVRPLPRTVFAEDKVEDAFRFLSTGKHKGKVLIQIRSETEDTMQSPTRTIQAVPKIYFDPDKTYILIGGLGGFGLELTSFLITRCAKKIILNSRRGITDGYQSLCLKKWSELEGVSVNVNTSDTSTLDGAESLVKFSEGMGPIGGIFNMALVLQDALFVNQTTENFNAVFRSKIYSGENMDKVSRLMCPMLDHFVVFSSIASGRGNPGQSNYGMANSALERLCEIRRRDGLPGLAVQYGPIGDVGFLTDRSRNKVLNTLGLVPQSINSCIFALETFMLQPCAVGSTFVVDEHTDVSLSSNKSPTETIAHILGIRNVDHIDKKQSLLQIGLDSLMVAEIKQTLYRNYNIDLDIEDIRDLTFNKISKLAESTNSSAQKGSPTTSYATNGYHVQSINAMLCKKSVVEIINDKSCAKKMFLIHPIEGNIEILLPLAKKLNGNIYGLQSTEDLDLDDLRAVATHFVKIIKVIQEEGPYFLCGYSYGGALAFEIGVQFEKQNEKVDLFLIDGTPSFVKMVLHHMYEQQDEKLEAKTRINIFKAFLKTFDELHHETVDELMNETVPQEKLLERLGTFVAEKTRYNSLDVVVSAERFTQRVAGAYFYKPSEVFKGQATLIRSDEVYMELSADYDLQKICKQPIKLEQLKGNHRQILLGNNLNRIAELINNFK